MCRSVLPGPGAPRATFATFYGTFAPKLPLTLPLTLTLTLTLTSTALAQYKSKGGEFNRLFGNGVPTGAAIAPPADPLPTKPQFGSVSGVAGGTSSIAPAVDAPQGPVSGTLAQCFPRQTYVDPGTGAPTGAATVLLRSGFGAAFAAGVPRFLIGDVIVPPSTQIGGVLAANASYWRIQPVSPGENFSHPEGDPDTAPPVAAGATRNYYYSPHAEKVFASQSGRVTITWVTRVPVAIGGSGTDAQLRYRYREESFAVSGATQKPTRTIYWTERSFNGPTVNIPSGSIETVNPIYNAAVPFQVAEEYKVVGIDPNPSPNSTPPPEKRTLWFEKTDGVGALHAYNVEGRIMVEYLGALKPGSTTSHVFLGADIVDLVRVAPTTHVVVQLGDPLTPRDGLGRLMPLDGSSEFHASPVLNSSPGTSSLYGSNTRSDGYVQYYAERENPNPDRIVFYWLQRSDAAINFLTPPAQPDLGIFWPVLKNHYAQIWPTTHLNFQAHYTVGTAGSTPPTGLQFSNGQIPQIVFQDDPAQNESQIDSSTQRLTVNVASDGFNRTLLKFSSGTEVWYVRLFTQADGRIDFQEGDGAAAIDNAPATVGNRIDAPAGYSRAGHIASGTGYQVAAYRNPFDMGAAAAESGAIIPVNAMPGDNQIRIWWFKAIVPPSAAFTPFYVPAKVGRYTVSYPATPDLIVLASNAGSGDLAPAEINGSLYIQNDRALPGFNPNEEHALMIAGRAYALRDDLNVTTPTPSAYTSEPFVLVSYTSPVDQRPAMHAFKVVRELDVAGTANDQFFNYPVTAGTILQGPMPLPLLPLPLSTPGGLNVIPTSARTTVHQGKTYFQGLPPHLQSRFYYDPQRGAKGSLVLLGSFVDEPAGEDYLNLNVLSADERSRLESVVVATDLNAAAWAAAIGALTTRVETFIPDPLKAGTYKSNGSPVDIGAQTTATISDSDTAVADYALTATGSGTGWVTMVFGNGRAFTPTGDPVALQVFKVAPRLYTGDLKVILSGNPLDEQVTLRHSGDFAARPQDYEFEWRYAPPQGGVAPPVYTYTLAPLAPFNTGSWQFVQNPAGSIPTAVEYGAPTTITGTLQRSVQINNVDYRPAVSPAAPRPGLVARSVPGIDFTAGVPSQIVFSADVNALAGFVVYVNGVAALAFQAPSPFANIPASTGLATEALPRQFTIESNFLQAAVNRVEVALFSTADLATLSTINFRLHAATESDRVIADGSPWLPPNGALQNIAIVGGSPTAPLGSPLLVMSDNYFTMRYRPRINQGNVLAPGADQNAVAWSRWMPPKLIEDWIKRVLAAINPFNQRMTDLYNNAVNTDVSILTQAGKRWEGDVALTLSSIDDFGLIEIYETVLNRGKNISIDSGYNYAPANDALLLAAGYLHDLFTVLGNEAFADAANPTISIDDSATVTEVNTSRFSFESQVKSVLEEELSLLRGRDDFLAPGTTVTPAYNRLFWNYTRGIDSGEALYAVNYNIREKAGSSTANGIIDAADAQRMFPQGHGDAYGHYLTALKGYYRLLNNPFFTWTPRSEAVTVLGQAVQIDYFDERKFASAAANVARTATQVIALTHRQNYRDNPAIGWTHFRDGTSNSSTGLTRHWGLDEWTKPRR